MSVELIVFDVECGPRVRSHCRFVARQEPAAGLPLDCECPRRTGPTAEGVGGASGPSDEQLSRDVSAFCSVGARCAGCRRPRRAYGMGCLLYLGVRVVYLPLYALGSSEAKKGSHAITDSRELQA